MPLGLGLGLLLVVLILVLFSTTVVLLCSGLLPFFVPWVFFLPFPFKNSAGPLGTGIALEAALETDLTRASPGAEAFGGNTTASSLKKR